MEQPPSDSGPTGVGWDVILETKRVQVALIRSKSNDMCGWGIQAVFYVSYLLMEMVVELAITRGREFGEHICGYRHRARAFSL
jgi:hypothetical protein